MEFVRSVDSTIQLKDKKKEKEFSSEIWSKKSKREFKYIQSAYEMKEPIQLVLKNILKCPVIIIYEHLINGLMKIVKIDHIVTAQSFKWSLSLRKNIFFFFGYNDTKINGHILNCKFLTGYTRTVFTSSFRYHK